jgi:hypothetical protein
MTGAQRSYLHTLAERPGMRSSTAVRSSVLVADASKKIVELQVKTGRGRCPGSLAFAKASR